MTNSKEPTRQFTVEEANATLPLVRRIVEDLKNLSTDTLERRERLSVLTAGRERRTGDDPYTDELVEIEKGLQVDNDQILEYLEELRELGVEPKGLTEGLVDFPTTIDGKSAYLCWQLDEPEILYWHGTDEGFPGRQPLTANVGLDADEDNQKFYD